MKVSVVIPCYNEGPGVYSIVDTIKTSKLAQEIILVDDGSIVPVEHIPAVTTIRHSVNQGKSQALKTGLQASSGDIIVFLDADLQNFVSTHLRALIAPVISGQYSLAIGEFHDDFWPFQYIGQTIAFSGQRAYHRQLLIDNINIFDNTGHTSGYLIEPMMNQRFFGQTNVTTVKLPNLKNTYKYQKQGPIIGLIDDFKMIYRYIATLGPTGYLHQLYQAKHLLHFD